PEVKRQRRSLPTAHLNGLIFDIFGNANNAAEQWWQRRLLVCALQPVPEQHDPLEWSRSHRRQLSGPCDNYLDVCCAPPDVTQVKITPKPTVRKGCGQRNSEGVCFRITCAKDNEAQFGELRWIVATFKDEAVSRKPEKLNVYQCGGTLIHPRVKGVTVTKAKKYSNRNIFYDLNLKHYSSLSKLGEFNLLKNKPLKIKFSDILTKKGFKFKDIYVTILFKKIKTMNLNTLVALLINFNLIIQSLRKIMIKCMRYCYE
ncbi:hypothetical protein TSAR_003108, partial [Trichomalopsis sarcophagae]